MLPRGYRIIYAESACTPLALSGTTSLFAMDLLQMKSTIFDPGIFWQLTQLFTKGTRYNSIFKRRKDRRPAVMETRLSFLP